VTGAAGEVIGMRDTRRTRVVLVALLTAALALIALSFTDGNNSALRDMRTTGSMVFGGAEHAAKSARDVFHSGGSSAQMASLEQQILQLRAELSAARLSKADYTELRKMLLLAGAGQYRVLAASVIAVGLGYQQTVTLDVGSADGIRPQETVINGEGLVGYVTSVSATTSTVLLASDGSAVVGVAAAPSGQLGWVTGPGKVAGASGFMHLEMLNSAAALKPGDGLVTAASVNDKPYVPGVPVGVVTKLIATNGSLTEAALVRPYVDFGALGVVGVVIVPPGHNPRFAALPPLPHPGPTVTVTVTAKPGTHRTGGTPSPTPSH
jgi:rod shape-determining protein MreC